MKFNNKGQGSKFGNKSGPRPDRRSGGGGGDSNFRKPNLSTSFKSKGRNSDSAPNGFRKGGGGGHGGGFNKGGGGGKFGKPSFGGRDRNNGSGGGGFQKFDRNNDRNGSGGGGGGRFQKFDRNNGRNASGGGGGGRFQKFDKNKNHERNWSGGGGGRFQKFDKNHENVEIKEEVDVKEETDEGGVPYDNFFGVGAESKGKGIKLKGGVKNEDSDDDDEAISRMEVKAGGTNKKGRFKKKVGGFQGMGLGPLILKGILRRGYNIPTPIQRKAIPPILEGRDVVAMARTGSGKTAAFLIPLFQKLEIKKANIGTSAKFPRALILSPTRELAQQTVKFMREIGRYIDFKVASILGGESMESQFQTLHDKPDIVVATPGRFMHLCVEMELKLDGIEYVVFDEADRLFEMGFGEQLSEILRRLPENRQTVMFSATLPKLLVEFSKAGLHDPTLIRLDVDTKLPDQLKLAYLACRSEDKLAALLYLLKNVIDERQQTIVFTATKHHVEYIHQLLDEANVSNCYIYSSLDPAARKISLGKFRGGKCNVMIVTDIAARGIDIPILDNVINFHFPAKPKLFMHRVGRVARAGRSGIAYSILSSDDIAFLIDLHLFLDKPLLFQKPKEAVDDSDSAYLGRIPQDLLNDENNFIQNILEVKTELDNLNKISKNGYRQYLKSRPNASTESNRRAKGIEVGKLNIHPIFAEYIAEDPMDNLITQMQSYRPNATIFEIGPKAGSETLKIMKLKRVKDQNVVERYRTKVANSISAMEPVTEKLKVNEDEPYVPYLPKDHHTELGLSVGTTFDRQVQEAVMDLTGDDSDLLKQQNSMKKWDQKKKRFVSMGNDMSNNKKKIKTESGAWIAASYKSDRYKNWMQKSKAEHQADDDDGSDDDFNARNGSDSSTRKPAFSKKLVKTGKNEAPSTQKRGKRFKSEIKRPEQILKQRKTKEKKLMKNLPKGMRKNRQKKDGGGGGNRKGGVKKSRK